MSNARLLLILGLALQWGCADRAVFVTKSSLGIDADTKPPGVSVAYDRTEGYYGPSYANGAVPPVVASIRTDGKIFNPRIKQVYATGEAARLLSDPKRNSKEPETLESESRPMFFGTSTTLGFKLSFDTASTLPDSVSFGYKRKEFSSIPIHTNEDGEHVYPSVLAAIDTKSNMRKLNATGIETVQFFASGYAAAQLAKEPQLRELMITRASEAVADNQAELAVALATIADTDKKADVISQCMTRKDKSLDGPRLQQLVSIPPSLALGARNDIAKSATPAALANTLKEDYDTAVDQLFDAIPQVECAED